MLDIPESLLARRDNYCALRTLEIAALRGWGMDGYVWQTTDDRILKFFRHAAEYRQEFAVYQRLQAHGITQLRGFQVPRLLHYDGAAWVLELSYVRPPFVLDFAAAILDAVPTNFNSAATEWIAEKQHLYGTDWAEVVRLLDALRHLGIHYTDVHPKNICVRPPSD